MLRQIYIIRENKFIYSAEFGRAIEKRDFNSIFIDIKRTSQMSISDEIISYDYFKYRINFLMENELNLYFILITGLVDQKPDVENELRSFKKEFLNFFSDVIDSLDIDMVKDVMDPIVDKIHRNLRPKISLVGFSGVGKTTITRLIRAEEIPMDHIPTITGDVATIKIGKLYFFLWDFAGQEQFSFLWNNFIQGSDAVLLITKSTIENVEKSRFFLELIKDEAPHAHCAVIGNQQDLPEALPIEEIERILGLKTYSMVAIDPDNRDKMIKIIADILEMSGDVSPLLKPLFQRDQLMHEAQTCLQNGNFEMAAEYFDKIADLCIELGDDTLGREFFEKSQKIKNLLNKTSA